MHWVPYKGTNNCASHTQRVAERAIAVETNQYEDQKKHLSTLLVDNKSLLMQLRLIHRYVMGVRLTVMLEV